MAQKIESLKLITALGNNDPRYDKTRHNFGFMWLNALQKKVGTPWKKTSIAKGYLSRWEAENIWLFYPGALMNINGGHIAKCLRFYKIAPESMLVAYDDLDSQLGQIKLKMGVNGHGGHNGIRDLNVHLAGQPYLKLKLGISRPPPGQDAANYVLSRPSLMQMNVMNEVISFTLDHLGLIMSNQIGKFQEKCAHWAPKSHSEGA